MTIIISNTCSAFSPNAIGTRVVDGNAFFDSLAVAIAAYDVSIDRVPGQHFISLPETAYETVSAGVGKRSLNPEDYVIRVYRGRVGLYLKRARAVAVESLAVVVYTREAYLKDPDVQQDTEELMRVSDSDATHVVVTVLASAGPQPQPGPYRFVMNLAGGNREALIWTADEIRAKASEIATYQEKWHVVAD